MKSTKTYCLNVLRHRLDPTVRLIQKRMSSNTSNFEIFCQSNLHELQSRQYAHHDLRRRYLSGAREGSTN